LTLEKEKKNIFYCSKSNKSFKLFQGLKTNLTTIDCGSAVTAATRPTRYLRTTATRSPPSTGTTTKRQSVAPVLRPTEEDGGFTGLQKSIFVVPEAYDDLSVVLAI
jgi:hypothetical protein